MEYSTNYKKVNRPPLLRVLLTSSILQSSCQHNSALHMGQNFSTPPQPLVSTDRIDDSQLIAFQDPQLIKYITDALYITDDRYNNYAETIYNISFLRFAHRYLYINNQLREGVLRLADSLSVDKGDLATAIIKMADIARETADKIEQQHIKFINKQITEKNLEKFDTKTLVDQLLIAAHESADPLLARIAEMICRHAVECYVDVYKEVYEADTKEVYEADTKDIFWRIPLPFLQTRATTALSTIASAYTDKVNRLLLDPDPSLSELIEERGQINKFESNLRQLMKKAEAAFGHQQGERCSICDPTPSLSTEENLHMQGDALPLMCGHYFHVNCMKKWFMNRIMKREEVNCPLCRKEISFNLNK